ncbi:OTU domain-containing protein 6B [Leucoagaricus sp. SymC.cos]|nr:OTU domain-containing protein 6B [Leucoagaricus sp. SymC.cos]
MAKKNKSKAKATPYVPPPTNSSLEPEDDDLMNDLLAQLDSRDQTVKEESAAVLDEMQLEKQAEEIEKKPKQSAKSRFQARVARKAVALAHGIVPDDPEVQARLEQETKDEGDAINRVCKQHRRQLFQVGFWITFSSNVINVNYLKINPDGHCLYSAAADQLALLGKISGPQANYVTMRAVAANYIESHVDDFLPFLPTVEGEDVPGATDSGLMSPQQFQQYCFSVRNTAVWGGEPEIQALSRAFDVPIYVVQGGVPSVVTHDPSGDSDASGAVKQGGVWLSYHRRMYGLGEVI